MISPDVFVILMAAFLAANGVISVLAGGRGWERTSFLRTKYDGRDCISGLLYIGIAVAVVLL
jgi:hypothetical protein